MRDGSAHTSERLGRSAASWLCLVGGMVLAAMVLLVPPWLDLQRLEAQHEVLDRRAEHYDQHREAYRALASALENADPAAVEFMAYHQLGLKPVGLRSMGRYASVGHPAAGRPFTTPGMSVEAWLSKPIPHLDPAAMNPPLARTRLARLATGPSRLALMALAAVSIILGLVMAAPKPPEAT